MVEVVEVMVMVMVMVVELVTVMVMALCTEGKVKPGYQHFAVQLSPVNSNLVNRKIIYRNTI